MSTTPEGGPAAAEGTRSLILVVDDDEDVRESVALLLSCEGFAVACAESALAALRALRAGLRPAAVLTDIRMSPVDGLVLHDLIKGDAALEAIPVVFMSATAPADFVEGAPALFVPKPLDVPQLVSTLGAAIGSGRARPGG